MFSGEVSPENYNKEWIALRRKYQGLMPPQGTRDLDGNATDWFDPGAKYHVAANIPYVRYFFAAVYQFQFHEALCRHKGHTGPLHECSLYQSKAAGERLQAMLAMGRSRPWQDALEALTGTREISADPILQYFAPLREWLALQNVDRTCGWDETSGSGDAPLPAGDLPDTATPGAAAVKWTMALLGGALVVAIGVCLRVRKCRKCRRSRRGRQSREDFVALNDM